MAIRNINGPQICDNCGNNVGSPKKALGGNFPGQYYVHCHACNRWHYTWPSGHAPSNDASTSAVLAPNIPTSLPPVVVTRRSTCSGIGCAKTANSCCTFKACRKCCIFKYGGCSTALHSYDSLPSSVRDVRPRPTLPGSPTAQYLQNQTREMEQAARAMSVERRLEEEDDRSFRQEIDRLRAFSPSPAAPSLPSSPRIPFSFDLSFLPPAISSPPPASTLSLPSASFDHSTPITPASSLPPPPNNQLQAATTAAKRPRRAQPITTHLNADWMGTSDSPSVAPLLRARQRAQKVEPTERQFHVVFWSEDNVPPKMFIIQDSPGWPYWNVDDSSSLLGGPGNQLEQYITERRHWSQIPPSFKIKVKKDEYYFIRCSNVQALDVEEHVTKYTKPSTHLRTNMRQERESFRVKLQTLKYMELTDDSSDEELKSTKYRYKRAKLSTVTSQRRQLSPVPERISSSSSSRQLDVLSTPELTGSSESSTSPSPALVSTPRLLSPAPSPTPAPDVSIPIPQNARWPKGLYAYEIVQGFQAMDDPALKGHVLEQRFNAAFNTTFVLRTYHRHRACYVQTPKDAIDTAVAAGRTPGGLWAPVYAHWASTKATYE